MTTVTAVLAGLTASAWGTMSYLEAGWLVLTAGCVAYLVGHLGDALGQLRAARGPVEQRIARTDVWSEATEVLVQACFGALGVYAALTPPSPVVPGRELGTLAATGLLVAAQLAILARASYQTASRRWITDELRREVAARPTSARPGGRRWDDPPLAAPDADPPAHDPRKGVPS